MKRVMTNTIRTLQLGALGAFAAASAAGCDLNLPVDNPGQNPFVPAPLGIIQGSVSYFGPPPCVKNGSVEGRLVVLLFDYKNPPPPDGLATTALNFATVPGNRLFSNVAIPTSGPGSKGNPNSKCATASDAAITAASTFTLSEIVAGQYQVRAFYSQHGTFNPLFDFANLPMAGDVGGAALSDPTTGQFMKITVGVPSTKTANGLEIPDTGFVASNVPVLVGQVFSSSRPYFWIDPSRSRGFVGEKDPVPGENGVAYPQVADLDAAYDTDKFQPRFPQDWSITGEQNSSCVLNPDPNCDAFGPVQRSLPSLHFRYGFPTAGKPLGSGVNSGDDLALMRSAKLSNPLQGGNNPFYGIEPFPLDPGATDIAATKVDPSQRFLLTRVFGKNPDTGVVEASMLHDNEDLEKLGLIAELYPLVVLAKLQENADGVPLDPPTPQSDPVVIIQGITLRNDKNGNGTMKATSGGSIPCGALAADDCSADFDPTKVLNKQNGVELLPDFTALVRPAALCVRPSAKDSNPKGTLVATFETDFNPGNKGKQLVGVDALKKWQASKIEKVDFGCLPPGFYTVNVVYPAGQAWTIPNNTGYCTFGLAKLINGTWNDGKPFETCSYGSPQGLTFSGTRPLLVSQQVFLDGATHGTAGKNTKPLIVKIDPSKRCMTYDDKAKVWNNNPANEDADHNGVLAGTEDLNGNKMLDMNIPAACLPQCRPDQLDAAGKPKTTNCTKL